MARQRATVGTEENLRQQLRDILAQRIGSGKVESFTLDLMDVPAYIELTDESRISMRKLLDGYSGACTVWNGVLLPLYRYTALEHRPHHVEVTYS
jgi:hypothetical protein